MMHSFNCLQQQSTDITSHSHATMSPTQRQRRLFSSSSSSLFIASLCSLLALLSTLTLTHAQSTSDPSSTSPYLVEALMNRLVFYGPMYGDGNWSPRPMTLVADYTYSINITLEVSTSFLLVNLSPEGEPQWKTCKLGRGLDSTQLEIGGGNIPVLERGQYTLTYFTPELNQRRGGLYLPQGKPNGFVMQSSLVYPAASITTQSFVLTGLEHGPGREGQIVALLNFSQVVDIAAVISNVTKIVLTNAVLTPGSQGITALSQQSFRLNLTLSPRALQAQLVNKSDVIVSIFVPEHLSHDARPAAQGGNKFPSTPAYWRTLVSSPLHRSGKGVWGPMAHLRDTSATWPLNQPTGGWWVTPIHSNVLASSGKVLLTGWGRSEQFACTSHGARKQGVTFILDPEEDLDSLPLPSPPAVPAGSGPPSAFAPTPATIAVKTVWESPLHAERGEVLYCSGHSPLRDGRILFAGGSVYLNLSTALEKETGLNYTRLFDPKTGNISLVPSGAGGELPFGNSWYPSLLRLSSGSHLATGGFYAYTCQSPGPEGKACLNPGVGIWNASRHDSFLRESTAPSSSSSSSSGSSSSSSSSSPASVAAPTSDPLSPSLSSSGLYGLSPAVWSLSLPAPNSTYDISPGLKDYTRQFELFAPIPSSSPHAGGRERQVAMVGAAGKIVLVSLQPGLEPSERFFLPPNAARPGADGQPTAWPCGTDSTSTLLLDGSILLVSGCGSSWLHVWSPLSDSWRSLDTGVVRNNGACLTLADGSVLLINGENGGVSQSEALDRGVPQSGDPRYFQIFDALSFRVVTYPEVENWSSSSSSSSSTSAPLGNEISAPFRGYHDNVSLLKDGRVLVGGGVHFRGDIGCEQPNIRILSPPYLNPSSGAAAVRPTVDWPSMRQWNDTAYSGVNADGSSAIQFTGMSLSSRQASAASFGSPLLQQQWTNVSAATPEPLFALANSTLVLAFTNGPLRSLPAGAGLVASFGHGGVTLAAMTSFTHSYDQNGRHMSLAYADAASQSIATTQSSGVIRVVVPSIPHTVPGEHLLFLIRSTGAPSMGLQARILAADEMIATAYSYPAESLSSTVVPPPLDPFPVVPAASEGGRSVWTPLNIALIVGLGGSAILFFIALTVWFFRDSCRRNFSALTSRVQTERSGGDDVENARGRGESELQVSRRQTFDRLQE